MIQQNIAAGHLFGGSLPFPGDWIVSQPQKVEEILSGMSVEEQARCVMGVEDERKQNLLLLSPHAREVARLLPPEEIYQIVKAVKEENALPVLSMISKDQLQYIFDLDFWHDDRYLPERALSWLNVLDRCDEPQFLNWLRTEEFDQKVVMMQSLLKVFKKDEMTDSYENTEGLQHFSPDGVYDIFFKVKECEAIKKLLTVLYSEDQALFYSIMEAVIWYPLTPTVEKAYRWRLSRTSERGIPDFEEAFQIYSRLNPDSLKSDTLSKGDIYYKDDFPVPPYYLLTHADQFTFLGRCVSLLKSPGRLDSIRWELVCLANKVMVADKKDISNSETRKKAIRKVLGYLNIGLELAAEGETAKGARLLEKTWMQFLFQAGYHRVMELQWKAKKFLQDNGKFLNHLFSSGDKDQWAALVDRFPQVGEFPDASQSFQWRDFESLDDIRKLDIYFRRWVFFSRFAKMCLGLTEIKMERHLSASAFPDEKENMDLLTWVTTALARFVLFGEVDCEPLPEAAAKKFLEVIFMHQIFKDETRTIDEGIVQAFQTRVLESPMAWTGEDKEFLPRLIEECKQNLEIQFGRLSPKAEIEWKYTHGLCIKA